MTAGKKSGSKLLYSTSDKQLFKKKSEKKSITYFDCYKKDFGCKARVKLEKSKELCSYVCGSSHHTHGDQESVYEQFKLDDKMKFRCSKEKKAPREVFDEEVTLNQQASAVMQFAKRHRTLKVHQSKGIPKNPKTLDEVKEYFNNIEILNKIGKTLNEQEPKMFYHETVITNSFAYVIFSSELILTDLPQVRKVKIDCTFKCVPKSPFKQLLILSMDYMNHVSVNFI